ncbi:MAG: MBL fold metallo-hydrolase [Promethearchaeia archaeon]
MSFEEFRISKQIIPVEQKSELYDSLKIKSYEQKLKLMEEKEIPQKPIKHVLNHLFFRSPYISRKTRESITKIIYFPEARVIILITEHGKELIRNRSRIVEDYGWFIFIAESEESLEKKNKKEKAELEPEKTIKEEEFKYKNNIIPLKQKINMRALYRTKEYKKYMDFIEENQIEQKPIIEVLDDFFFKYDKVPKKEKEAIKKINYYNEEKVVVIKALFGDKMYENLDDLVSRYGWYFYITGVPVGESEISLAVDKVEKRFNEGFFKNISIKKGLENNEDIKITLFPVALRPNHNCLILGIGSLKIMLDCGINEEHFEIIRDYLNNYDTLLEKNVDSRRIYTKEELEAKKLKEIEKLREFEDAEKEIEDIADQSLKKESNISKGENQIDTVINKELNEEKHDIRSKDKPEIKFEKELNINDFKTKYAIDAIFISHSHFDHISGLKDIIKLFPDAPILMSRISLDLFLLRDSDFLKQKNYDIIENEDYLNVVKNVIYVENGSKLEFKEKDCYLSFFHAGHMPGALMLLVKIKNFRFLFTGDYTYWDIAPFAGTRRFLDQISKPIDFLLIDGSSAHEDFGDPTQHIRDLIMFLEHKAEYGDNVLIGADPSSLAITFMLSFWRFFRKLQLRRDYKNRPNIYVDMMVRKNIQVINHRYEYIYGPISRLIREKANPFNSIKFRWFDQNDLNFLKTRNNIIISHPPDLSYGIIRNIIQIIGSKKHNLVYLAGSIHEQPGLDLINGKTEIAFSENWKFKFRAMLINTFMPNLKIKLHGDKTQLLEMIKALTPKEVCFFHQSPKKLIDIAEEIKRLEFIEKVSVPPKKKLIILN